MNRERRVPDILGGHMTPSRDVVESREHGCARGRCCGDLCPVICGLFWTSILLNAGAGLFLFYRPDINRDAAREDQLASCLNEMACNEVYRTTRDLRRQELLLFDTRRSPSTVEAYLSFNSDEKSLKDADNNAILTSWEVSNNSTQIARYNEHNGTFTIMNYGVHLIISRLVFTKPRQQSAGGGEAVFEHQIRRVGDQGYLFRNAREIDCPNESGAGVEGGLPCYNSLIVSTLWLKRGNQLYVTAEPMASLARIDGLKMYLAILKLE